MLSSQTVHATEIINIQAFREAQGRLCRPQVTDDAFVVQFMHLMRESAQGGVAVAKG